MKLVTLDVETFWSDEHSLKKLGTFRYVTHPDTEIQSCAIKVDSMPTEVVFGEAQIRRALEALDLSDKMVVGHNMSGFDALILDWRLGIRPKLYGCTLAMARPSLAKVCGLSLDAIAKHLHVGKKLSLEATNTKGKRLADFTRDEIEAMRRYNAVDTDLCYEVFRHLRPQFSVQELLLIDMTIRMRTEPQFVLDADLLDRTLAQVRCDKLDALLNLADQLGVARGAEFEETAERVRKVLASNDKFAALLRLYGIEPPMKVSDARSKREGKTVYTYAFAKTDEEFAELVEHPNPVVSALVSTRLGVKSTQLETRIRSFMSAASFVGGRMPIPLAYCGADTSGRWSGEEGLNAQNLPRIKKKQPAPSDALRLSLMAPPDHLVVVADQSGIELRVNHFLWKVMRTVDLYRSKPDADLYRALAARRFGLTPEEVSDLQRQLLKVESLGLGFGAGAKTFQRIARVMANLTLSLEEADVSVQTWRFDHREIVAGWDACKDALRHIASGREREIDPWGLCHTSKRGIHLPSGRVIEYPHLRMEDTVRWGRQWVYAEGRHMAMLTGPKVDENIVQALARDTLGEALVRVFHETGMRPALLVHDEPVYVVLEPKAHDALATVQRIIRTPPSWWPELVTWSEGGVGLRYGVAKQ